MRNAALLAIGVALLLIQGNAFRLLGPLKLYGSTPSLILPMVLFLGVNEPSMARGAMLSFALGYLTDLFASAPIGLFTFTSVAVWWLSRVAAVRISAQTIPTQMFLTFVFSCVQSVVVLMLLTIFGQDSQRPLEISAMVAPHAVSTALFAPFVFRIAHRLQGVSTTSRQTEGGAS